MLSLAGIMPNILGQDMTLLIGPIEAGDYAIYDNFAWMEARRTLCLQPNQEIFLWKYEFMNKIIPSDQNNINYDKQLACTFTKYFI